MIVGLQGSGKTTTCAKLAKILEKKQSKNPLLVACDVYRPAAIEQLQTLGKLLKVTVYSESVNNKPEQIAKRSIDYAAKNKHDLIIIDTAGRLHVDKELMQELTNMRNIVDPQEVLLILDGMIGQDIINITNSFQKYLKLSGVIITKLDGDTRGGAALSIRYMTRIPIKYIGIGENLQDLKPFYPDRMADRIMGMGDLKSLLEAASENIDQRTFKTSISRMMTGRFDMQDLLNQMRQMHKMGKIGTIAKMLPGMPKINAETISQAEDRLKNAEILISSMTLEERKNIRLLKHISRKERIIKGSGRSEKIIINF